jgi:predicted nicotinamide N-methyase
MENLEFGRRWWTGLAAAAAYLVKRPEVVKGVASMAVFVGKSYVLQIIQTL